MLSYFEKTSPDNWSFDEALKEMERLQPERQRDHHIFAVKKDLEALKSHKKEAFRNKAAELLSLPYRNVSKAKTTKAEKSRNIVNNNATVQTNNQAFYSEQYVYSESNVSGNKNGDTLQKDKEVGRKETRNKETRSKEQDTYVMDMAIHLNLNEISCSVTNNKFLSDFINKYRHMDTDYMYKLDDGTYLEERMFRFGLTCKYEHLCHSFIFDPKDNTYIQRGVLTSEQVEEILKATPVEFPQLNDDLVDYLMKYSKVKNVDDLRTALHENSTYKLDFKDEKNKLFDWIHRTLDHFTLLYENQNAFTADHSEQWFQTRVWLPLELLFENIKGTSSIRGENCCQSSALRKNLSRTVPSTEKITTQKMGNRVDLIVRNNSLEYACQEDKCIEDNTKVLEERHFKVAKEMKDMLWSLMNFSDFTPEKIKKLVSIGITTFKFKAYFDICDMKLGYVARITRSEEFIIPSSLNEFGTLLETMSVMLLMCSIVKSSITIINEVEQPDLRSKLKRPYSQISSSLQTSLKKNISATTPEDDTSSRFKSFFLKK